MGGDRSLPNCTVYCAGFIFRGLIALSCLPAISAQGPQSAPLGQPAGTHAPTSCLEPPPLVGWRDYNGPLEKLVGSFGRKLERKAVHPPHYKPDAILCSLELKDKFVLFLQDTYDPVSLLSSGFNASLDQAGNRDRTFGQGAAGYSKRFAADFTSQTVSRFFKDFAYPAIFSEDPRYYRLGHGSGRKRLGHAIEHAFVARRDNGSRMFNLSEWLATASSAGLNNFYHPGNPPGFAPAARGVGFSVAQDMGFDVLREFWPEIARRFKMPFRDLPETGSEKPAR
jgi:hypothetical protein